MVSTRSSIGSHDNERIDIPIVGKIIHDALYLGGGPCHPPLILISAYTMHQIQHVVFPVLTVSRRKIYIGFLSDLGTVPEIIISGICNMLDGSRIAQTHGCIFCGNHIFNLSRGDPVLIL